MQNTRWILVSLALCRLVSATPSPSLPATILCTTQCQGAKAKSTDLLRSFDPVELRLKRGNGGYWGLLTTSLNVWSADWCLAEAVERCGGLEKVVQADASLWSSGQW